MEDDYDYNDQECPICGYCPTHWRACFGMNCDDGLIDSAEDDPINFAPGEDLVICRECYGRGFEHWCPKCGHDLNRLTDQEICDLDSAT